MFDLGSDMMMSFLKLGGIHADAPHHRLPMILSGKLHHESRKLWPPTHHEIATEPVFRGTESLLCALLEARARKPRAPPVGKNHHVMMCISERTSHCVPYLGY